MTTKRAFIAGCGAVSPYGAGVELFWNSLRSGKSGLKPITRFDATPYRNTLGGEVPDFAATAHLTPVDSRAFVFLLEACKEALSDAYLGDAPIGMVFGTNF